MNSIIETPQFINWFGNWKTGQNCSKVVDENGYPLVVYHGTENEFSEFKSEFMGKTGTALGHGFYFTSNKDDAGAFGNIIKAFYLNIKKPLNSERLTMSMQNITKLVDTIDRTQSEKDPDFGYGILSDYGDVDYEGRNNVLRIAVKSLMGNDSDVELVGDLINSTGDYDLVVTVLRNVLGYDGIINMERGVYVVHHPNQVKEISNVNFSDSNDFMNETRKLIFLNESQFQLLKNFLNNEL